MTTRLYLHIGGHKTGTTAIQADLNSHRDALMEQGVLFPSAARFHYTQHRLAFALRGRTEPITQEHLDPLDEITAIKDEIRTCAPRTVILSSEVLFSLPDAAIGWLREQLAEFDVTIVGYIRRQDDLFASAYNHRIRAYRNDFVSHYSEHVDRPEKFYPAADFGSHLDRWSAVFGREAVTVRCYEQENDTVAGFRALTGISAPLAPASEGADAPVLHNVSLSVQALEIMRHAKRLTRNLDKRLRVLNAAQRRFPERNMRRLMTVEERMRILSRFTDGNAYVFGTYLDCENLYDPERLAGESPEPRIEPTIEDAMSLLVKIV